jgi:hypothetical protein
MSINKKTIESIKTVTISVLITVVIAFPAGVFYQHQQYASVNNQIEAVKAELAKK